MSNRVCRHYWYVVHKTNKKGETTKLWVLNPWDQYDPLIKLMYCSNEKCRYIIDVHYEEDIVDRSIVVELDDYWHLRGSTSAIRKMLFNKFKK